MDTIKITRWRQVIYCQQKFSSPLLLQYLQQIEKTLTNPLSVLKNDKTSTVVQVKIDQHNLVIKRSNTKSVKHFLRRLFSQSRARKNWLNTQHLLKVGIRTFEPVAYVEERWGPLRGRSYFICSYIDGLNAKDYFNTLAAEQWLAPAQQIVQMIQDFAKHRLSHRDLNLSNIIMVNHYPWIIDLDAMKLHRWWFTLNHAKRREIERFLQNCREVPGVLPEMVALFERLFQFPATPLK